MTNVKLTLNQWRRIPEFLRTRTDLYVGKRFINAILYMTHSGIQWRLSWSPYHLTGLGRWNSIYKRFNCWAERGIWQAILEHFASDADMESVMIDATHIRAHSSAAAKWGIKKNKDLAEVEVVLPAKSMPS